MRFASLGSGSAGNALLVEINQTRILLDCGFGLKETENRLGRLKTNPESISAILITHEHDDHAGGVFRLAAKYNLLIYMTYGTYKMSSRFIQKNYELNFEIIDSHQAFEVKDLRIQPYPVPHDAREPVQFIFNDGSHKLGVLTDTGKSTKHIENVLSACDAMVLECNHDLEMLQNGPYSYALKKRVGGELGHLDNDSSAKLLSALDNSKLKHIVAAHLSTKNNTPNLAKKALSSALDCSEDWIKVATQQEGFDWLSLI